jgi:short-subunit dehydrogenase
VITARREALLAGVAEQIRANGSQALAIAGDALDEAQADQIVREGAARFGGIDLALLNVGSGPPLNTAKACPEEIKHNMRVNYDSMINFFCPLVRQMKTQAGGGVIAHTNSLAGFWGVPMQGQYSAAKAACRIFLDTARYELKPYQIRVQTLCPGFVVTEKNKEDGLPKPFSISEEAAAEHILNALRREAPEYLFPTSLKIVTRLQGVLPGFIIEKALSRILPEEY